MFMLAAKTTEMSLEINKLTSISCNTSNKRNENLVIHLLIRVSENKS